MTCKTCWTTCVNTANNEASLGNIPFKSIQNNEKLFETRKTDSIKKL